MEQPVCEPQEDVGNEELMYLSKQMMQCMVCYDRFCLNEVVEKICGKTCRAVICHACLEGFVNAHLNTQIRGVLTKLPCPLCIRPVNLVRWKRRAPFVYMESLLHRFSYHVEAACEILCPECHEVSSVLPDAQDNSYTIAMTKKYKARIPNLRRKCAEFCHHQISVTELVGYIAKNFDEYCDIVLDSIVPLIHDTERRVTLFLFILKQDPFTYTVCCDAAVCFRCKVAGHHESQDCSTNVPDLDELAQCPDCGIYLVKGDGCNSMTCVCGGCFEWDEEVVRFQMQSLSPKQIQAFQRVSHYLQGRVWKSRYAFCLGELRYGYIHMKLRAVRTARGFQQLWQSFKRSSTRPKAQTTIPTPLANAPSAFPSIFMHKKGAMPSKRPIEPPMVSKKELEARIEEADRELAMKKKDLQALEDEESKLKEKLKTLQSLQLKMGYECGDLEIQRNSLVQRLEKLIEYEEDVCGNVIAIDIDSPPEKKVRKTKITPSKVNMDAFGDDSPSSRKVREKKRKISVASPPPSMPIQTDLAHKKSVPQAEFADYFWSTTDTAKLLSTPRNIMVSDGCNRKLRCSAFHPTQSDFLTTISDNGTLMLWKYQPHFRDIKHVLFASPEILRKGGQACVDDISWSNSQSSKLALGFRDPIDDSSEICVVEWDDGLTKSPTRVWNRRSTLMSKGVSCIEWYNEELIVTGDSNHGVVLWKYTDLAPSESNMRVLHDKHKSDVRALCVHEYSTSVISGASDGLVIKLDLSSLVPSTIIDRRQTNNIPKINSVLAHPHNPNLLMVSCVYSSNQTLLLHDLRAPQSLTTMPSMTWWKSPSDSRSMTQTITPRWSSAGMHVSCGSINGQVHLWDIRACKRENPPHQSLKLHKKTVLHANWHAQHNALVSISNDRNIGVRSMGKRLWSAALALVLSALVVEAGKLNPIIVRGNKMYDSKTGKRFFMRGITYDYDVSDDHYAAWSKDIIETNLKPMLGYFNTFRLYNVNPDKTYDQFMAHMDSLGVYVMISASPANVDYFGAYRYATITKTWGPDGTAVSGQLQKDQTKTCYPSLLLYFGKAIIKDFAKYDNTLGIIVANEILQYDLTAAACVKMYVADLKNWMRVNVKMLRILPLAYAGADSAPQSTSANLQPDQYTVVKIMGLLCGDKMVNGVMQSSIDIYLLNEYRWCNTGTIATYDIFKKMATGVPIVVAFGETGCDTQRPRKWTMVPYLFSSSTASQGFTDVFSGAYAYTFGSASIASDTGYPLFLGGGKDIVAKPGTSATEDFTNLVAMYKANPSVEQIGGFTKENICKWTPPELPVPVTPIAAKSGWIVTCDDPNIKLKSTDKWETNTRQGAVCTTNGQVCEVTIDSKLGTSEEDLCGTVLTVVSGGGTCKPGAGTCGKYGQCVSGSDGVSSCQCLGCWSGLSCSVLDQNKCSQLNSDPSAPKYIFTGIGVFLGVMTLIFGGLGIVAGKKSRELKLAEQQAANQTTSI